MKCPNCNKRYLNTFKFCPHCGTKKPEPNICPKCELELYKFKICPRCGSELIEKSKYMEDKTNKSFKYKEIAHNLEDSGQYEEAIENYKKSRNLNSSDFSILNNEADCYYQLEQYDNALESLNQAIKICNDSLNYNLKDIDAEFRHLIKFNPENFLNKKAEILEELERYEEAIECYDELIKIIPDETNYFKKITLLRKIGREEEAEECSKEFELVHK